MPVLHPDRLLPQEGGLLRVARAIYDRVAELPVVSPHGHTDPAWFAENTLFPDPASTFVTPDHYILRMLRSVGENFDSLGVSRSDGGQTASGRSVWKVFASRYSTFAGTPSAGWMDHALGEIFGVKAELNETTAETIYDQISERLADDEFRPRALLDKFGVEIIATTDDATSDLRHHRKARETGENRVIPTYRPDAVSNPLRQDFKSQVQKLGDLTGEDCSLWSGFIEAHRKRRAYFRSLGATASDHGLAIPKTYDLPEATAQKLLTKALASALTDEETTVFQGMVMTEMAGLAVEDGMVTQIHAGVLRNTDRNFFQLYGADHGSDIPCSVNWAQGLSPLLEKYGSSSLSLLVFTLDESTYARELAPMAGYWPSLKLGPPWWFHDSPEGIRRYLHQVFETAGHRNLAGFNDDTRAIFSIPGRHDTWRREVAGFLSRLVSDYRLSIGQAHDIATWLCYDSAKEAYKL